MAANQVIWGTLSGVLVYAVSGSATDALLAWGTTVGTTAFGTMLVAAERIHTSNQLTASAKEVAAGEFDTEMGATNERVASGAETVERALMAFDELVDDVEDVNTGIQEINRATDEQASTNQDVVSMVEDVAGVADQTAGRAATAAKETEAQTSGLSTATDDIGDLAAQSRELESVLAAFETTGAGTTRETPRAATDGGY